MRSEASPVRANAGLSPGRLRALSRIRPVTPVPTALRVAIGPAVTLAVGILQYVVFPHPGIAPFVFFYVGVVIASWFGGRVSGLSAAVLSATVANYAFVAPYWAWSTSGAALTATVLFVAGASLVALLCGSFRDSLLRAERNADLLRDQGEALRTTSEQLSMALTAGRSGIFDWNTRTNRNEWSEELLALYGLKRDEFGGRYEDWVECLVPEDRQAADSAVKRSLETGEFSAEFRIRRRDTGEVRWMHGRGRVFFDEIHAPARLVGINVDITDRKRTEAALRENEARLRGMFENAAMGIVEMDAQRRFVAVNDHMCAILGRPCDELLGVSVEDVTAPEDRARCLEIYAQLQAGNVDIQDYEKRYLRRGGERIWVRATVSARRDEAGRYLGAIGTVEDISERKAAEAERDRLLAELRDADRRKNEFLGMLSHELRNPLAPIRNSLFILGRAAPGGEQARRALAVIERQVQHTTRIVDDLLDVTRITRGKIRLQRERLDLGSLSRRAAEDHRALFERKGVELEVVVPDREVPVNADATRLAQLVGNLLLNAAKFTPAGGRTVLSVEQSDGEGVIAVRDTGSGIEREVLPRLFQPFVQAESTLDRSTGGLGLGLALVKRLAELHGGRASVHSEGPGRGSAFTVRLPLERGSAPRSAAIPAPAVGPSRRRVLVIEDNIDNAETLKEALELNDHVVEIALTGPDGLEKVRSWSPDVVLCDIGLPGMDGFRVAKEIRADARINATPLIALSGYAQPEDVERSKESGFDLHLAKPPDLDALERAIVEVRGMAASTSSAAPVEAS